MKLRAVVALALAMFAPAGCSSSTNAAPAAGGTAPAEADAGSAGDDGGASDATAATIDHVVVPMTVTQKYADTPQAQAIAVDVELASPDAPDQRVTVPLLVDTGSSGVSVFTESLGGVSLRRVGSRRTVTYGGGDVYEEQSAEAIVGVGGVRTSSPIHVSVVDSVHCASGTSCGAAAGPSYLTSQGFYGIFGVGTRYDGDVYSLLAPTDEDMSGFTRHALPAATSRGAALPPGVKAFDDRTLPLCATIGTAVANDCAPGLLDSGTWYLFFANVSWGDVVASDGTLREGTDLDLKLEGVFDWHPDTRYAYVSPKAFLGGFSRILGMPFFTTHDVLYDLETGDIGVRDAR